MRTFTFAGTVCEPNVVVKIGTVYYSTTFNDAGDGTSQSSAFNIITAVSNLEDIQDAENNITVTMLKHASLDLSQDLYTLPCEVYQYIDDTTSFRSFIGQLTSPVIYAESDNTITFDIRLKKYDAKIGHVIEDSEVVEHQDVLGKAFPIVYGTVHNYTALKYTDGLGITAGDTLTAAYTGLFPLNNGLNFGDTLIDALAAVQLNISGICVEGTLTAEGNLIVTDANANFYSGLTATVSADYKTLSVPGIVNTYQGRYIKIASSGNWVKCYKEVKTATTTTLYITTTSLPVGTVSIDVRKTPDGSTSSYASIAASEGTDVLLLEDGNPVTANKTKSIVSIGAVTIQSVTAERTYRDITTVQQIPSSYYTINTADVIDGVACTTIELAQELSTYDNEGWDATILLTVVGKSGKILDVISNLLTDYSTYTQEAVPAGTVTYFDSLYCNFVLSVNESTIATCKRIAALAGLRLAVRDDTVSIFASSMDPGIITDALVDSMIQDLSISWSLTNEEDLTTKYLATWINDLKITNNDEQLIKLINNDKYGILDSSEDYLIFPDRDTVDHVATWHANMACHVWKTVTLTGYIETLQFQAYDYITMPAIEDVCNVGVRGLVQSVQFEMSTGFTTISLWLPVLAGTLAESPLAWTSACAVPVRTSTDLKRDYIVEINLDYTDSDRDEKVELPDDYDRIHAGVIKNIPNDGYVLEAVEFDLPFTVWAVGYVYAKYQIISYSGAYYVCVTAHQSEYSDPPSGSASWLVITDTADVTCKVYGTLEGKADILEATPSLRIDDELDCQIVLTAGAVIFEPLTEFYTEAGIAPATNEYLFTIDSFTGSTVTAELKTIPISWALGTVYHKNTIVLYGGEYYVCIKPHIATTDSVGVDAALYWFEVPAVINCTVYGDITGAGNLIDATPLLAVGDDMLAYFENDALHASNDFYISTGGSGTTDFVYVKIITTISKEDNVQQYVARIVGSEVPATFVATTETYVTGDVVVYAGIYYVATAAYAFTAAPMDNPDVDTVNWIVSPEITPYVWQEVSGTLTDKRQYVPQLKVNDEVPVILRNERYYFVDQFIYTGGAGTNSIGWNETDGRIMAVVSDTI